MYPSRLMLISPRMEAIILAGGKAERLGDAAGGRPKSLVPVAGRPLLAYQIGRLARAGARVEDVTLAAADYEGLEAAHRWISGFEMARNLAWEIDNRWEGISERFREGRLRDGLVCVLTCVEPCWSFEIHRNRATQKLELQPRRRQQHSSHKQCHIFSNMSFHLHHLHRLLRPFCRSYVLVK